jgi:hypothetical protein
LKKYFIFPAVGLALLVIGFFAIPATTYDNLKLRFSPYVSYVTLRNNPLLPAFDPELPIMRRSERVDSDLIFSGGPPRDGIPAIDDPQFDLAENSRFKDEDTVIGVYYKGEAKAYPYLILN